MAGSKLDYAENKTLDAWLGGPALTLPATVYIAISLSVYSDAATGTSIAATEPSGGSYIRVVVTNNATNWPAAVTGSKSNGAVFTFPAASADWGTVKSVYVIDAATNGNAIYGADLAADRLILTGDTASFAIGSLVATEA